ncbi:hypothetical protein TNCV_703081 [Trichonephila clavipes]|nr:hypothetical protein TNCV_703081 [Trichonephila clavipes]
MLSTSVWMMDSIIFYHSDWRRHVSSFTDFRWLLHTFIRPSNSAQRFSRIEVGTQGRQVQLIDLIAIIPIHAGPRNITSGIAILEVTIIQLVKLPQLIGSILLSRIVEKESALSF